MAKAASHLGSNVPEGARNRSILLDSSLMESSIYDREPTGSCNFGQYEVIRALAGRALWSMRRRGWLWLWLLCGAGGRNQPEIAKANSALLVRLAQYLLSSES